MFSHSYQTHRCPIWDGYLHYSSVIGIQTRLSSFGLKRSIVTAARGLSLRLVSTTSSGFSWTSGDAGLWPLLPSPSEKDTKRKPKKSFSRHLRLEHMIASIVITEKRAKYMANKRSLA